MFERVAKSLGRVADHVLEVFGIESEPTVVVHCGLLAAHTDTPSVRISAPSRHA